MPRTLTPRMTQMIIGDLSFRVNLAFPWAYVSIGDALSWNDYKREYQHKFRSSIF